VLLSGFVVSAETRLAVQAVLRMAAGLRAGRVPPSANPLVLHGPPGTGKSHLAAGLVAAVTTDRPSRTARVLAAAEFAIEPPDEILECDLLIVEDLQHLPLRAADALVRVVDFRLPRRLPLVVTANAGPGRLPGLPARLTSRLSGGLVVGLEPLTPAGRRLTLRRLAKQRGLQARSAVLNWIADHTPGGVRPLLGALTTLEALSRGRATRSAGTPPPDLATVIAHWRTAEAGGIVTPERVAKAVARHFRLNVKALRTRRRQPAGLWPCQVAMYLTRELTGLSWPRIGAAFGGRDASTVRHAYQKVGERADADAGFAAEMRRITAEFVREA
jgi:chromosomal replication initiator protein